MTPKIIELKQAPVVLVEKPDEDDNDIVIVSGKEIFYNGAYFELPKTDPHSPWRAVGILSDLTEEQFAECVDKVNFESGSIYKNYKTFKGLVKASESFDTLLESENVYTENPYARPSYHDADRNYWLLEDKWQEAQSRTIDPTRTVVLLRKEEKK